MGLSEYGQLKVIAWLCDTLAARGDYCRENFLASAAMEYFLHCPWGLFLMASAPFSRTILKTGFIEQSL
jgi:hypothetical protein